MSRCTKRPSVFAAWQLRFHLHSSDHPVRKHTHTHTLKWNVVCFCLWGHAHPQTSPSSAAKWCRHPAQGPQKQHVKKIWNDQKIDILSIWRTWGKKVFIARTANRRETQKLQSCWCPGIFALKYHTECWLHIFHRDYSSRWFRLDYQSTESGIHDAVAGIWHKPRLKAFFHEICLLGDFSFEIKGTNYETCAPLIAYGLRQKMWSTGKCWFVQSATVYAAATWATWAWTCAKFFYVYSVYTVLSTVCSPLSSASPSILSVSSWDVFCFPLFHVYPRDWRW